MKTHLSLTSENISRISKNMTKTLKSDGLNVSHHQLLNSFAKSLGFPNLHAAQSQDFMQERKVNQYVVQVELKTINLNYYDISEDVETTEKVYVLFSNSPSKHFNFHLLSKIIPFYSLSFSSSSQLLFDEFIKTRNDNEIIDIFEFFNIILINEDKFAHFFKTESDIQEFDAIFINEIKELGEIANEENGGAIIDFHFLNATPDNIQFMLDNNMIHRSF